MAEPVTPPTRICSGSFLVCKADDRFKNGAAEDEVDDGGAEDREVSDVDVDEDEDEMWKDARMRMME